ncbi:penicillin acylase family protein [Agromyces marinus]|uniref:Penicillin amidase n=1 Tax=Agromyces marinus TaxID=1389020 RepID=A0ABM8H545_9MICO|nr:penicillin acylase family protein [Agromyces marinus]UIP59075.1 Acyl-homoserine lactone acylase QuiP [Agromyces marinus]BDZ55939.1 penicillin amidase [Agromyces marinus]
MGTDAPRTRRRGWAKVLVVLLASVLVLGAAAVGYGWWTIQRSFPTESGRIAVPGLQASVTVYRDDAGIPQLVAETDHDLLFAQGYVHAQDRFWEMDFRRHVTAGRVAELFGESQVATDAFIRTLNWRGIAEQEYEALDADARTLYDAYADGVNAYLAERSGAELSLEYAVLALQNPGYEPEPWSPVDSIAWLKAMAWDLRSNLGDELDRAVLLGSGLSDEQVAALHPDFPWSSKPTIVGGPPPAAPAALDIRTLDGGAQSERAGEADAAAASDTDASTGDPADLNAGVDTTAAADAADLLGDLAARIDAIPELMGPEGGDLGSNSWVVSGALTETGLPLLANDPHLGPAMPSIWVQMGLHCTQPSAACTFDVAGYGFAGLPGIVIGHNDRIAWGFTNLGPDVADLYVERVAGDAYELDGAAVPLTLREEVIEVAGGEPVTITVRSTERGPIVSDVGAGFADVADGYGRAESEAAETAADAGVGPDAELAVSLQWTALQPGRTAQAIFDLDRASDWEEFRAAAERFDVPAQNLVYADVDGNIGYQAPGLIPVRATGDGTVPLPGWTSANGWTGWVPFADLPSVQNPERGYLVTANNAVSQNGPMLTQDWDLGYRAEGIERRLAELVAAGEPITAAEMADVQLDTRDANAETFLPVIAGLELDGDAGRGAALLAEWDAAADADSAEAAYFAVFWKTLLDRMFDGLPDEAQPVGGDRWFSVVGTLLGTPGDPWWSDAESGATGRDAVLAASLEAAWAEASALMGDDPADWRWGRLHTLTLTNQTFGTSGIGPIEWLFNRGPYETGGGSAIVNANGWDATEGYGVNWVPSMRMVVDLADFDDSTWVNLTGASGHAFHPHYDDQAPLWQRGEALPWAFTREAVQDAAVDALVLTPGD